MGDIFFNREDERHQQDGKARSESLSSQYLAVTTSVFGCVKRINKLRSDGSLIDAVGLYCDSCSRNDDQIRRLLAKFRLQVQYFVEDFDSTTSTRSTNRHLSHCRYFCTLLAFLFQIRPYECATL